MSWDDLDASDWWTDKATDAGWMSEDEIEEMRTLFSLVEFSDTFPRAGNRSDAALVLLDHALNPPRGAGPPDPHVLWARTLLQDKIG